MAPQNSIGGLNRLLEIQKGMGSSHLRLQPAVQLSQRVYPLHPRRDGSRRSATAPTWKRDFNKILEIQRDFKKIITIQQGSEQGPKEITGGALPLVLLPPPPVDTAALRSDGPTRAASCRHASGSTYNANHVFSSSSQSGPPRTQQQRRPSEAGAEAHRGMKQPRGVARRVSRVSHRGLCAGGGCVVAVSPRLEHRLRLRLRLQTNQIGVSVGFQ
jgi:hypothetical protein